MEGRKVYLSGQGADEIFSDYGLGGQAIYAHSNFGGHFPDGSGKNLSMALFLWLDAGGISSERRVCLRFLRDRSEVPLPGQTVVQEFLSLGQAIKNSSYKSVLRNLFEQLRYPFAADEKCGFVP